MSLTEQVKVAGVVGEGGAGFPTHVKLSSKANYLIINAAECEPLIETDKYLVRTYAEHLVSAIKLVAEHLGSEHKVIALKKKYTAEIEALKKAIEKADAQIELFLMPTFYPAGDEQVLVSMICGKSVPERGIPIDVGAVVDNVGTMLSIYDAVRNIPVTEKFLSVVGEVEMPIMLRVPIGTPILECIKRAHPQIKDYAIILGGPMMGKVQVDPAQIASLTVTKTTGNIIVLPKDHMLITRVETPITRLSAQARSACIQCKMCTDLCPRYRIGHRIRPNLVMRNIYREPFITDDAEYIKAFGDAVNCCDCGVCEMFSCPMGLSPRRINSFIKGRLRERGLQVERNMSPVERGSAEYARVPTDRLISRLNLTKYSNLHAKECFTLAPQSVMISFCQHIGKPAVPVKNQGDTVKIGDLIAAACGNALSANIHASIDGVITRINESGAVISRRKEE